MRFVHRGSHMKEIKKGISIPKHKQSLLLGHEEELCPPTASSSAGPLRLVCACSLGKGISESLREEWHPLTSSVLKNKLDLYSIWVKQGTVYSYLPIPSSSISVTL